MIYKNQEELFGEGILTEENGKLTITEPDLFCKKMVDNIVDTLILSNSKALKGICHWIAHEAALHFKVLPASIQSLYAARGKEEFNGFTVPALNLRTLTYDLARAAFRSSKKIDASAIIFEIALSEIEYTRQTPMEYTSVILLAAIREGYTGPVFLQGDHFQVNKSAFIPNKESEINRLKDLIMGAIDACFYNIDIDSSTLVDLDETSIDEQQKLNYETCAYLTKFVRQVQPKEIEVSIGGEIGEVGGKNSTTEELHAFMKGYTKAINGLKGLSKMSIQTGSFHGGVPLPDGTVAKVNIDFETLGHLSEAARNSYGLAGCVQHGASTLPNEAFHTFPGAGCAEIHLATQFQNMVYDYLPLPLKEKIYDWLHQNCADKRGPDQTIDQFIYKTRKFALGPFKKEIFSLTRDLRNKISKAIETEFDFLFDQLGIKDTKKIVEKYVKPITLKRDKNSFLKEIQDLQESEV